MSRDLEEAGRVLDIESRAILALKGRLGESFIKALDLIQNCEGKVVVTGMGKSGQVGRKIASTMASTGTPAIFLHPAESSHGDLGVLAPNDVIIAISYGGESPELKDILNFAARKGIPLIGMTAAGISSGKGAKSSLAMASDVVLDIGVEEEACPLGLAPTASSTATLALGDTLAMCLLKRRVGY
jgi:arabinose-5-phosphate isomerase